ncbi:maleylpyruvate isomerase family mycothiol-dependent enzyme [Nocardia sp. NPDC003979]
MTLVHWDKSRIIDETCREYGELGDRFADISVRELDNPTRCSGWTVRGVLAHLLATGEDVIDGTIGTRPPDVQARGYPQATPQFFASGFRSVAQRLRPHLESLDDAIWAADTYGVAGQPFGVGVLTLVHEIAVHADDVDDALGRRVLLSDSAVTTSTEWLSTEFDRLDYPKTRVVLSTGQELTAGSGGEEMVLTGTPLEFMRAATGRIDAEVVGGPADLNIYGRDRRHEGV